MAPPPPASEAERPRLGRTALVLAACGLGLACRQTVVLDPTAAPEGAGGTAGRAPVVDAGTDASNGGAGSGGFHFDGGRTDLPFCFMGQIQQIPITMRTPDIIVSVDRSSGMQSWFGTGTRLDVIQQQMQTLVMKYRGVRFGYEEFPSPTSNCGTQGCCAGDVALPNYNNYKAINHVIHACDTGGSGCNLPQRPIADALAKCWSTFDSLFTLNDTGHRYVVLLTSGDPTCTGADPTAMPCDNAITQVTKLSRSFINTAVFGVGDGSGSACLDMLATYGGIPSHIVKTPNDLSSAFESVVETIAEESCKIDVRSPPADTKNLQLLLEGIPVPNDASDGWTFDQDTNVSLTVHGTYCRALIQSGGRVELIAGCAGSHN
jgi:hypothetical protein